MPPSRHAARLLTTPGTSLRQADRRFVDTLNARSPEIRTAAEAANAFCRMVRERDTAALDDWLVTAGSAALRGFVNGLISDIAAVRIAAVRAALSQPWSNGPVEGQVNRLKLMKRQMHGRATFDLLRSRVPHVA